MTDQFSWKIVFIDGVREGDVVIRRNIDHPGTKEDEQGKVIDVGGSLFSWCIDAHVHMRTPGALYKEDFATGSMAAIAGVTSFLICQIMFHQLLRKLLLKTRYGFRSVVCKLWIIFRGYG
jgi:dihydroorotase-like cyclic amidohydrolase